MKLQACDILLFRNDKNDPISKLSRWAIGPYSHVAMYVGQLQGVPMVYESRGRGVTIASLLPQTSMPVAVMRPVVLCQIGIALYNLVRDLSPIINTAFQIAADEKSFYDYLSIVHSVLPRVIAEKLPWLPLPIKYHRDIFMICSEAVAEVFWRNGIDVISQEVVPLPGDFAESLILKYVGQGKLMEDIVP